MEALLTKPHRNRFLFCLLVCIIACPGLFCSFVPDAIEPEVFTDRRFYAFNPETIIDSLAHGQGEAFTLMMETPVASASTSSIPVKWRQEEFLRVAQAIHEQSWGEALEAGNLFHLSFAMNCSDIERGTFREAFFNSYKLIPTENEEKRIEHWITIKPADELIVTETLSYRPGLRIGTPIDLEKYQITVDEALRIADQNGGYETRVKANNDCEISAFSPAIEGGGWEFLYIREARGFVNTLFEIFVNPNNGEYEVVYPEPK